MNSIGTRLNSDTYQKVEERCRGSGCSKSEYIKRLIANDLNKNPTSSLANEEQKISMRDEIPEVDGELQFEDEEIEIED